MATNPNSTPSVNPGSLYDRLLTRGTTSTLGLQGITPQIIAETKQSKLHYTYSINGIPTFGNKPIPSALDIDGVTPSKYWDNRPH